MLGIKKEKMKKIRVFLIVLGVLTCLTAGFFIWLKVNTRPVGVSDKAVFMEVKQGTTLHKILNQLKEKQMIRSITAARYLWWVNRYKIKTGYYKFTQKMAAQDILEMIAKGKEYLVKVTIPEGFNYYEIPEILKQQDLQDAGAGFLQAVKNKKLLEKYKIPFDSAEGYLFPSTYHVPKNISGEELAEKMIATFFKKAGKAFTDLSLTEQKTKIIMASIVEKEAAADEERPRIASVFYNRLAKGMAFESCATVIYCFEQKGIQKKRLLYRDLKIESPYNTYLHKGLPPSPIANPGLLSILAALNPEKSDYIYFVYKGNGRHIFSKTIKDHMSAYRQYILYQNQRKK